MMSSQQSVIIASSYKWPQPDGDAETTSTVLDEASFDSLLVPTLNRLVSTAKDRGHPVATALASGDTVEILFVRKSHSVTRRGSAKIQYEPIHQNRAESGNDQQGRLGRLTAFPTNPSGFSREAVATEAVSSLLVPLLGYVHRRFCFHATDSEHDSKPSTGSFQFTSPDFYIRSTDSVPMPSRPSEPEQTQQRLWEEGRLTDFASHVGRYMAMLQALDERPPMVSQTVGGPFGEGLLHYFTVKGDGAAPSLVTEVLSRTAPSLVETSDIPFAL